MSVAGRVVIVSGPPGAGKSTLARAAFAYAADGYVAVIDWVVGPWFLDVYREEARRVNGALDYVVLLPTEQVAIARSRERDREAIADYAHLRPLYRQLGDLGDLEACVLDNTLFSLSETVARAETGLAEGRFRVA